jgi:membrane protease YdiL (CAAX protease family)
MEHEPDIGPRPGAMVGATAAVLATVCVVLLSSFLVALVVLLGVDVDLPAGSDRVIPAPLFILAISITDICLVAVGAVIIGTVPGRTPFRLRVGNLSKTAAGVGAVFLLNFIGCRIMEAIGEPLREVPDLSDRSWQPAVILLAVLIAPAAEELFFREALYSRLMGRYPLAAGLLSSVAFGMLHFSAGGPVLVLTLAAMGGVLAWLRQTTGSLTAPFIAHSLNNLGALILLTGG